MDKVFLLYRRAAGLYTCINAETGIGYRYYPCPKALPLDTSLPFQKFDNQYFFQNANTLPFEAIYLFFDSQ